MVVPCSPFNAAQSFVNDTLYQASSDLGYTPIFLPSFTESFTQLLCSKVWLVFRSEQSIIQDFLMTQPTFRAQELTEQISKNPNHTPDLGLYDAFQILSLSGRKVLFLCGNIDRLFCKKNSNLLTGFKLFLKKSNLSLLVGTSSDSLEAKCLDHEIKTTYTLNNFDSSRLVAHVLSIAHQVCPHLVIPYKYALAFYSECKTTECFIKTIQNMVLYQRSTFDYIDY